jgi:hypothetical protein
MARSKITCQWALSQRAGCPGPSNSVTDKTILNSVSAGATAVRSCVDIIAYDIIIMHSPTNFFQHRAQMLIESQRALATHAARHVHVHAPTAYNAFEPPTRSRHPRCAPRGRTLGSEHAGRHRSNRSALSLPLLLSLALMLTKQEYALFAQLAPLPDPRSLDMTFGVFLNPSSLSSRPRLRRLRRRSSARCTNRHPLRSRPPRLCTPRARCRDRRANDFRDVLGGIRTVCLELSRVPRGRQARSCWQNGEATGLADITASVRVHPAFPGRNVLARPRRRSRT